MKSAEEWVDILGFEGLYQIKRDGTVRSLDRRPAYGDGRNRIHKGKILNPSVASTGYLAVGLTVKGKTVSRYVHKLVALHFIPNPNNYPYVMHKDSDPLNPYVDNLMWGTPLMNNMQALNEGRRIPVHGYKHPLATYTKEQYEKIWSMFKLGSSNPEISREMGVPARTIQNMKGIWIKYGKNAPEPNI